MIKTLTKHGNSWAVIIDKPILDLLNIAPETPLVITTDGHSLTIAPAMEPEAVPPENQVRDEAVRAAMEKAHQKFGKAFKKLAE